MNLRFPKPASCVTPGQLRELLSYDSETGLFRHKPRRLDMFSDTNKRTASENCIAWNKRYSGASTLRTLNSKGYLVGGVLGSTIYAHRAAWAITHGNWPVHTIDHINGVKTDNRIVNLRDIPNAQNHRNVQKQINNTSGYVGVTFERNSGLWLAQIGFEGASINLGHYSNKREAALVRLGAQKALGYSDRHGGLEDDL